MTDTFAAVVVGGGPAGAATALALRRRGVGPVLLLEGSHFEGPRIGESIPPDTKLLLQDLGLFSAFLSEGHEPCHGSCSSWGSEELGYNDYLFSPHGSGYHLDRRRFDPWLWRAAEAACARASMGTRWTSIEAKGGSFELTCHAPPRGAFTVQARFVVDATGRAARLARRLGAERLTHDRLTFLYAFFPPGSSPHESSLTLLEARPDGYWYAARLPDGRLVIASAEDPTLTSLPRGDSMSHRGAFAARLQETTHTRTWLREGAVWEGDMIACEAPSARLSQVAFALPNGPAWLAVGDAASSFDPISSQGIHKALQDGFWAAEAIAGHLADPGGDALAVYADRHRARFAIYLHVRAHLYALERRWPESPFWARRREASALPP